MRLQYQAAAAAVISLTLHSAAAAQSSVDQAHATVNRLLDGSGGTLLFTTGRVLETAHSRISSVRTANRCTTAYASTSPDHPDLPQEYRGKYHTGSSVEWDKVTTTSVSGDHFYYDEIRPATGRPFIYHFQLASAGAAAEFAAAAKVLLAACGKGAKADDQPAEEAVHDPRGNTASLAIDRRNGSRYGWAVDYQSLSGSDTRALAECKRGGSGCQVVLRFTGGCGAFAADQARGSSIYGWGTALTRGEAENRAQSEARKRGGTNITTRVWGCNSVKAAGAANPSSASGDSGRTSTGAGFTGTGLSDEVIRRNAEAKQAHQATVDQYQQRLKANEQKVNSAIAERRAVQEAHERDLAKARAVQAQFERDRAAYREEYKRVTGRYPDQ